MTVKFGNATIIMQSKKGNYGSIEVIGKPEEEIKVCYLVICKYSENSGIYLLLCDENMSDEQDSLFDSVDEALLNAQSRSKEQIVWEYPKEAQ